MSKIVHTYLCSNISFVDELPFVHLKIIFNVPMSRCNIDVSDGPVLVKLCRSRLYPCHPVVCIMNYVGNVVTGGKGSVLQGESPECPRSAQQIQLSEYDTNS